MATFLIERNVPGASQLTPDQLHHRAPGSGRGRRPRPGGWPAVWDLATARGNPWDVGELLWWLHRAGETRDAPRPVAEPFALMLGGDTPAASAAWEVIGSPFWAALARTDSDDPADLRAALAALESLGATATHGAVVRDLRRRGAPVPRGPRASSGGAIRAGSVHHA